MIFHKLSDSGLFIRHSGWTDWLWIELEWWTKYAMIVGASFDERTHYIDVYCDYIMQLHMNG